jgi:hypothetical protein
VSVTDMGNGRGATGAGPRTPPADAHSGPALNGGSARPDGSGGFGLAGIAERVASCGGSLSVGPGRAGGFAVTARLPAP